MTRRAETMAMGGFFLLAALYLLPKFCAVLAWYSQEGWH